MKPIIMMFASLMLCSSALAQATKPAEAEPLPPTVTRVYDVSDLPMTVQNFPYAGPIGMPREKAVAVPDGSSGNLFGGKPDAEGKTITVVQERTEELKRLIEDTVAPDTWRDNGGQSGSIREIDAMLIVTQTKEHQAEVGALLGQLRSSHGVVRVQADWVLLDRQQVRELVTNDGVGGGGGARATSQPAPKLVDRAALAKLPEQVVHYRGELTCFTGQTVSLSSGRASSVIYDGEPVVAQGSAAVSPDVRQVQSGAMLQITPTVLRDAGFAVVEVQTRVAEIGESTREKLVFPPTTQSQIGMAGPEGIDKLNMTVQELKSTLRVPLGQPVLVGGMTFAPTTREANGTQLYLIIQISSPE